jgi:hypothetical protein
MLMKKQNTNVRQDCAKFLIPLSNQWKFGKSKVFLKDSLVALLDQMREKTVQATLVLQCAIRKHIAAIMYNNRSKGKPKSFVHTSHSQQKEDKTKGNQKSFVHTNPVQQREDLHDTIQMESKDQGSSHGEPSLPPPENIAELEEDLSELEELRQQAKGLHFEDHDIPKRFSFDIPENLLEDVLKKGVEEVFP